MFENRQLAVFEGKCRRFRNSSQKYFVVHEQSAVENSFSTLCTGRFILVESVVHILNR